MATNCAPPIVCFARFLDSPRESPGVLFGEMTSCPGRDSAGGTLLGDLGEHFARYRLRVPATERVLEASLLNAQHDPQSPSCFLPR